MTQRHDLTEEVVRAMMALDPHESSGKLRISPSSKKTFEECALRWWYIKIKGVTEGDSEATLFGNRTHKLLECYKAGTWWEPTERAMLPEELCLSRVLPFIPEPVEWMSEVKVTGMCGALPYVGFIDVLGRPDRRFFIGDLKTSSNPARYLPGPTGQPLEWDPQTLFYAKAVSDMFPLAGGKHGMALEHYQTQRPDRGHFHRHVTAFAPRTNIDSNWTHFEVVSDRMAKASQVTDPMELPYNTDACYSYGKPCPASAICPRHPTNQSGVPSLDNPFAGCGESTTNQGSTVRPATPENTLTPPDAAPQAVQTESIMIELIEWLHQQLRANGGITIAEAKAKKTALGIEIAPGDYLAALARAGIGPDKGTAATKWRDTTGKSTRFIYRDDLDAPDPEPAPEPGNNPTPDPEPEPTPDGSGDTVPSWAQTINSLKKADMVKVVRALQADMAQAGGITEPKVRQRVSENSQIIRVRTAMVHQILNIMAEAGMGRRHEKGLVPLDAASGTEPVSTPASEPANPQATTQDPQAPTQDTTAAAPSRVVSMAEPTILVISGFVTGEVGMEMMTFDELMKPFIDEVEAEGGKVDNVFVQPLPSYLMEDYGKGSKRAHAKFKVAFLGGKLKLPRMLHAFVSHPLFGLVMPDIKSFYRSGIVVNAGGR